MFRESGYLYLILMDSSVERNESFSETGMLCLFGKYPSFENVEAVLRCLPVPEPEEFNHPNTPPPMTTHLVKEYEKRISKKPKLAEEKMNVLIQATRTEKGPLLLEEENVRTNPPLTSHQNEYTDHDGTRKHKDKWALSVRSNLGPRGRAFAQYFSLHPTLKVKVNHVGEFSLQPGFEVQYLARRQPVPNNLSVTFKFFGEEWLAEVVYQLVGFSTVLETSITHVETHVRAVLRETEDQAFDRACCNQSKTLCNATFIQALVAIHKQLDVPRLKLEGKFTKLPEIDKLGPKSRAVTEGTALFGLRSERVKLHCLDFLGNS